ncbi:MAG: ROK family protein [Bacteroidota bacterium]
MSRKFAIGTDIGGSHISCAMIDLEKGAIVPGSRSFLAVDNRAPAEAILGVFSKALSGSMSHVGINRLAGIGFAMPGPFDYAGGIARFTPEVEKYEHLCNVDVATRLRDIMGLPPDCPLRFMNDASAFAVGEAWLGEARGFSRSVSVTLGTGFGSAFVENGIPVVEGVHVPANGCFWHLPFNGRIADDSFSSRWFVNQYYIRCGIRAEGVKEIAGRAATDPRAMELFEEFGTNLGNFSAPWLSLFGAGVLIIGGNISGAYNLFGNYLQDSLKKQNLRIQITLSGLREDAAITGSARMLDETFWQRIQPVVAKM